MFHFTRNHSRLAAKILNLTIIPACAGMTGFDYVEHYEMNFSST